MRKLMRWLMVLALLLLAWLGLVLSEWLPRPTEAELAAIAALQAEPTNVGGERNAFAAFWLFGYDVPESEIEAIAAADVARFNEEVKRSGVVTDFKSSAEGRYPTIAAPPGNDPLLCDTWGSDCLTRVRSNLAGSRARVAEFAQRLARSETFYQYDYYHYQFQPRFDSPIGVAQAMSLRLTSTALDYLDGQVSSAFDRLCTETAFWRRLRSHADILVVDMVGIAQMSGAAQLYAQMLAEQPATFAAPCTQVFEPLVDSELEQCAEMRFEHQSLANSLHDALSAKGMAVALDGSRWWDLAGPLANESHLIRMSARDVGRFCMAPHRERLARRDPAPLPPAEPICSGSDWIVDPLSCYLGSFVGADFETYYRRVLDLDARLKLVSTIIWMRAQPADGDRAAQFTARSPALSSPAHDLTYDATSGMLRMTNLEKGRGQYWQIPFALATTATDAAPSTREFPTEMADPTVLIDARTPPAGAQGMRR